MILQALVKYYEDLLKQGKMPRPSFLLMLVSRMSAASFSAERRSVRMGCKM